MRNRQIKESIDLLSENPPANLPIEISARKQIIQGQALCRSDLQHEGENALDKADNILPSSSPLRTELVFAQGNCSMSSPVAAIRYFEKAAELARSTDPFIAASALGNIGYLLGAEGRHDEAIGEFQQVAPLAQAAGSQLLEEKTLGNLGESYSSLGDFKSAIASLEQAQQIASALGRLDDEESWLVTLGRSYQAVPGDYPGKAEPSYVKALSIATKLRDVDISKRCLHNLVQLALEEHQLGKAETYWKQEVEGGSLDRFHDVDASLDEGEIALAHKDYTTARRIFPGIIQDPGPFVIRRALAQSLMGQSYWMEGKVVLADQMFRDGMQTIGSLLSTIKEESRGSFLDQNLNFDIYINFLVAQNKPSQALQIAEYVRELTQDIHSSKAKKINFALIQHGLNQNQVVLDYQLTENESYLWVLTRRNFQIFHLPSHQELNPLITSYNSSIQDQRPIDDRLSGQDLYKALVQPAEKLIPKGAHVIIVPSKILCLLNFETLVVPGSTPHYWIEDVVVQNRSSLASSKAADYAHGHNAKDLLLIGAPEEVSASFPTLKHASDEIARVKDRFPAAKEQIISGGSATPQSYKSSHPQEYRFIHFVTHGIANEKAPMESAIVLSGTAESYKLYARDIITTPLKADLVTISACYGAGKRWYVSEGMVGLGWAFMRAGARQVVAALWEVDDASTPQLMDDFYGGLTSGKNAADALRAAKINMLHTGGLNARPYYWASLQLYGGS